MADDERRAEIEAIQRVLEDADLHLHMRMDSMELKGAPAEEVAEDVLAALDRVRDARGDDEATPACVREYHAMLAGDVDFVRAQRAKARADIEAARSPQGEDHEPTADELDRDCERIAEARHAMHPRYSAQGEDHEAGKVYPHITLWRERRTRDSWNRLTPDEQWAEVDRLSRVSPSREGTVAVEDVEKLVDALRRIAYGLEGEMGRYDAPRDNTWWGRIALDALAAVSRLPSDRPEHPEPDALGGLPPSQPKEDG